MTDSSKGLSEILREDSPVAKEETIKEKISEAEEITGRRLIAYIEHPTSPHTMISKEDTMGFEDVLNVIDDDEGDLLINSSGGRPNAAEKILIMCRQHFSEEFNTVVCDYAKSAATMIAVGSDKIYMGHSAELGPVDPQLSTPDGGSIPAQAFLSSLDYVREQIKDEDDPDPLEMYMPILRKIDPEIITISENSIAHSKSIVETWLKEGMLEDDHDKAEDTAQKLCEGKEYNSHGKVINFDEANKLGLNVEKMNKDSSLWEIVWEIYCRCWQYVQQEDAAKVFASSDKFLSQSVQVND